MNILTEKTANYLRDNDWKKYATNNKILFYRKAKKLDIYLKLTIDLLDTQVCVVEISEPIDKELENSWAVFEVMFDLVLLQKDLEMYSDKLIKAWEIFNGN